MTRVIPILGIRARNGKLETATMMFDRIYCYEFHGVKFSDLQDHELSSSRLPSDEFYAELYKRVEPSGAFQDAKRSTGALLAEMLVQHGGVRNVRSWGAGIGAAEAELVRRGFAVDAVEVGRSAAWPESVPRYDRIEQVPPGQYDAIIEISTLYSQGEAELSALLRKLAARLRPGGLLILAEQDTRSIAGTVRGLCGRLWHRPSRGAQFWGYLRGPAYYVNATPLDHLKSLYFALNPDLSYAKIAPPARIFDRQLVTRRSRAQFHLFRKPPRPRQSGL
jgi:hypothetical protein